MQGALQALKEAEAALPAHPRIMSELAATYRQMGLDNKADNYWEKVENLEGDRSWFILPYCASAIARRGNPGCRELSIAS
jgi:hypothetical protein